MQIGKAFELLSGIVNTFDFCLAGGAISSLLRGETPRDFDLFFINKESYELAVTHLINSGAELAKERKSSKLSKIGDLFIDLVSSNEKSFHDVIDNFDLIHVCHFYTPQSGLVSLDGAVRANAGKEIRLHKVSLPYLTLGRIAKNKKNGFFVGPVVEGEILDYCYKATWGPSSEIEYNI